jgi:hypothetical protein
VVAMSTMRMRPPQPARSQVLTSAAKTRMRSHDHGWREGSALRGAGSGARLGDRGRGSCSPPGGGVLGRFVGTTSSRSVALAASTPR